MPLVHNPKYPGIAKDYERSYQVQKQLSPDIWLAAHASQYKMDAKRKAGSFVDPEGYKAAIEQAYTQYRETLEKERKTAQR
jgi:metallo-beta-lactamase class B